MLQITYKNLQYQKESELYSKLQSVFQKLSRDYEDFSNRTQQQEKEFFNHLSHSVRINNLQNISGLISHIKSQLQEDVDINLFVFQSPISNALCMPRFASSKNNNHNDLVIIVSQHFLNELTANEQLAILGHELAHLLFGHVRIPAKILLQSNFKFSEIKETKSDVLKWLMCAEISCDIVGFISCNCDLRAFSEALLKFVTGLTASTISYINENENVCDIILQQYEEISSAAYDPILSTHPLTSLRLKIISEIVDCDLIKNYGTNVSDVDLANYQRQFNDIIDKSVSKIYPEIISNHDFRGNHVLFDLCMAVALADGIVKREELRAIRSIIQSNIDTERAYESLMGQLKTSSHTKVIQGIVRDSVNTCKLQNYQHNDIIRILRHLLIVAASDTAVQSCELETIYTYAKEFGFTKQMIVALVGQLGLA